MTFASSTDEFRDSCDCDDCGTVPEPILRAIRQRKRQRFEAGLLKRTQERTLTKRELSTCISLWKWTMPLTAEPLVEFGSSHRILWIQNLMPGSSLRSIGTGIIGSSNEEQSRSDLDWQEGNVYLIPSNGGKAVGWIHTNRETTTSTTRTTTTSTSSSDDGKKDDTPTATPTGHAILHICKIPLDQLKDVAFDDNESIQVPNWIAIMMNQCRRGLEKHTAEDNASTCSTYYKFGDDDCDELRAAFHQAEETEDIPKVPSAPVPTPKIENSTSTAPAPSPKG
jgi:hypothetical protein